MFCRIASFSINTLSGLSLQSGLKPPLGLAHVHLATAAWDSVHNPGLLLQWQWGFHLDQHMRRRDCTVLKTTFILLTHLMSFETPAVCGRITRGGPLPSSSSDSCMSSCIAWVAGHNILEKAKKLIRQREAVKEQQQILGRCPPDGGKVCRFPGADKSTQRQRCLKQTSTQRGQTASAEASSNSCRHKP